MKRPTNRTLALLAAGAIAVGGAGAAIGVAASGGGKSEAADLAAAINRNKGTNLTEADVRQAMQDVFKARLDEAVKAGRITQAQADEMLQRMKDAPQRRAQHEAREAARIAPIAKALGMTADQIRSELRAGKSLAKLAESEGVSRDKLLAGIKEGIQTAAKSEGVTFSEDRLNEMAARVADRTGGPGRGPDGPRFGGHHGGRGGTGGFPPFGP